MVWDQTVSEEEVKNHFRKLIQEGDADELTPKILRNGLLKQFPEIDVQNAGWTEWFRETLNQMLLAEEEEEEQEQEQEGEEDSEEDKEEKKGKDEPVQNGKEEVDEDDHDLENSEEDEREEDSTSRRRAKREQKQEKPVRKRKRKASTKKSGIMLSPQLAAVVGVERESNRFHLTKLLWNYIKENQLQNPKDKREILCDEKLRAVFGRDKVTGFKMNAYLSAHIWKEGESVSDRLSSSSDDDDDDDDDDSEVEERVVKRPKKKRAKKDPSTKDPKERKRREPKPSVLSPELAAVTGTTHANRFQVVKLLWQYIKEHSLQNPKDKREIVCDEKLEKVFGVKKVTGFSMNKYLSPHLTKAP